MLIRKATSLDAVQIGKIHVESWRTTYRGIVPSAYLDGLDPLASAKIFANEIVAGRSKNHFIYVAEEGMEVVGYAMGGPQQEKPEPGVGEVYAIYLLSDSQGRGVGRQLLSACEAEFSAMKFKKMCLFVLADNPYQRFYESAGGVLESYDGDMEIGGKRFKLLKYIWHLKNS